MLTIGGIGVPSDEVLKMSAVASKLSAVKFSAAVVCKLVFFCVNKLSFS